MNERSPRRRTARPTRVGNYHRGINVTASEEEWEQRHIVVVPRILPRRLSVAWINCVQRNRLERAAVGGPATGIAPLNTTLVLAIFSCFTSFHSWGGSLPTTARTRAIAGDRIWGHHSQQFNERGFDGGSRLNSFSKSMICALQLDPMAVQKL
jgi:hypothetical protein